jgi:hypothetical protein
VRDGVTGRLADVGDAPGLAKVVADLLSDRTVALRLAAAAETRVRALTLESMVARHEAVYRRAVRGSSLPECAP